MAERERIELLGPEVEEILDYLGWGGSFVTDYSILGDFPLETTDLVRLQKQFQIPMTMNDRLVEIAQRLREARGTEKEQEAGEEPNAESLLKIKGDIFRDIFPGPDLTPGSAVAVEDAPPGFSPGGGEFGGGGANASFEEEPKAPEISDPNDPSKEREDETELPT